LIAHRDQEKAGVGTVRNLVHGGGTWRVKTTP
jgi:hypothetical protein